MELIEAETLDLAVNKIIDAKEAGTQSLMPLTPPQRKVWEHSLPRASTSAGIVPSLFHSWASVVRAPKRSLSRWTLKSRIVNYLQQKEVPVTLFDYKDQRFGCLSRAAAVLLHLFPHLFPS